jgi:hypothetical protein
MSLLKSGCVLLSYGILGIIPTIFTLVTRPLVISLVQYVTISAIWALHDFESIFEVNRHGC